MTYESHCADMARFKATPMSKKHFDEMQEQEKSVKAEALGKLRDGSIRKQSTVRHSCNWLNQEEKKERRATREKAQRLEKKAPPKKEPYRPKAIYTPEEALARRKARVISDKENIKARRKIKRAEMKALGLLINGKPRAEYRPKLEKPPKKIYTTEETRAKRLKYAQTYQAKHREKFLAYQLKNIIATLAEKS